jgi:hypothetical protein
MRVVVLIVLVAVACCGCFGQAGKQVPGPMTHPESGNWLEIANFEPAVPVTLHPGERLHVIVRYGMHSVNGVRIFVRPSTHGKLTPGYRAHGSPVYSRGEGEAVGWFTFDDPTKVHEVRIQMVDAANPDHVLVEIGHPIESQWVHP